MQLEEEEKGVWRWTANEGRWGGSASDVYGQSRGIDGGEFSGNLWEEKGG